MTLESKIDEKGRINIPIEIRKKMNLIPGEIMIFQIKGEKILLRKVITPKEFIEKSKAFGEHLKKKTNEPITTEKIFE